LSSSLLPYSGRRGEEVERGEEEGRERGEEVERGEEEGKERGEEEEEGRATGGRKAVVGWRRKRARRGRRRGWCWCRGCLLLLCVVFAVGMMGLGRLSLDEQAGGRR